MFYTYFIYPLLVALLASRRRLPEFPGNISAKEAPSVSVIIPAHNEERCIERKIENTLALDYPRDKIQIVIASDGSTDRTVELAQKYAACDLKVIHFPERTGKIATIDRTIRRVDGEIVLITDATAVLEPASLRLLISHFQDPAVGCVAGNRTCVATGSSATEGEGLYLRYEAWIKQSESRVRSCLGGYGPILAVRRSLVPGLRGATDDFYIPIKIFASTGARTVFEPRALARIPAAKTLRQEVRRKARTHTAVLCDLPRLGEALIPWRSEVWWELWSHHVSRLFIPWAMLVALAAAAGLLGAGPAYQLAFCSQIVFYAAAAAGFLLLRSGVTWRPGYTCFYFVLANAAIGLSWLQWLRGKRPDLWDKTERVLPGLPSGEASANRNPDPLS